MRAPAKALVVVVGLAGLWAVWDFVLPLGDCHTDFGCPPHESCVRVIVGYPPSTWQRFRPVKTCARLCTGGIESGDCPIGTSCGRYSHGPWRDFCMADSVSPPEFAGFERCGSGCASGFRCIDTAIGHICMKKCRSDADCQGEPRPAFCGCDTGACATKGLFPFDRELPRGLCVPTDAPRVE